MRVQRQLREADVDSPGLADDVGQQAHSHVGDDLHDVGIGIVGRTRLRRVGGGDVTPMLGQAARQVDGDSGICGCHFE